MAHEESHPQAGQTVILHPKSPSEPDGLVDGAQYWVEDYWDKITGKSWGESDGNPAALKYAFRTGFSGGALPLNDEVVYGKIGSLGHIVHVSELGEVVSA